MTTLNLTAGQFRAVRHLLRASALGYCPGVDGRVELHADADGAWSLTIADIETWSWSSGEEALLAVIAHIAGLGTMPDLTPVDAHNKRIVREAVQTWRSAVAW